MAEYAGESLAKKVARVRLYTRVRNALKFMGRDMENVKVMFLPGPDAAEVGALKHILKVKPENVVGVDLDGDACEQLYKRWPKANIVKGNLHGWKTFNDVLHDIRGGVGDMDGFDFIHLDLMGNLSSKSEYVYGNYARLCAENGVMAVTYLRGREMAKPGSKVDGFRQAARAAALALEGAKGEAKKFAKLIAPDPERALSHLMALNSGFGITSLIDGTDSVEEAAAMHDIEQELYELAFQSKGIRGVHEARRELGRDTFTALASYAYRAEVSPMGVLAAQRVDPETLESDSYAHLRFEHGRHTSSVIKKDAMIDLLAETDILEAHHGREAAAEIINVSPGTLAAWRAHRTMGTYKKAA